VLLLFLALPFAAGLIGSRFGPDAWFTALSKPAWNPPSWVFAPVWTLLYLAMGVAAWLVWRRGGGAFPLLLWGLQLLLNALWTPLFFGLHRPDLALLDIGLLWLVLAATTLAFWRASTAAGVLMLPYLAWVSFALALNAAIWRLNV
jgi:benzodiazapine receptor